MLDVPVLMLIIAALGLLVTYLAYVVSRKKDECADGKQDGIILTELGYIKSGVEDIKKEQGQQREQHITVVTRLTAVEESAKQAHKRIDKYDGKVDVR